MIQEKVSYCSGMVSDKISVAAKCHKNALLKIAIHYFLKDTKCIHTPVNISCKELVRNQQKTCAAFLVAPLLKSGTTYLLTMVSVGMCVRLSVSM